MGIASGKIKESSSGNPERGPGSYRGFHGCLLSRCAHALHATLSSHLIRSRLIARVSLPCPPLFLSGVSFLCLSFRLIVCSFTVSLFFFFPCLSLFGSSVPHPLSQFYFHHAVLSLPSPALFSTLSRAFSTSIQSYLICPRLPETFYVVPFSLGPGSRRHLHSFRNRRTRRPASDSALYFCPTPFATVRKYYT